MDIGLIGRVSERRLVGEALAAPDVTQVRICGPSGSGKTALAVAALADADAGGMLSGWGKYTDGETRSVFGPVMAGLRQLVDRALDQLYEPDAGLNSLGAALGDSYAALARAGLTIDGLAAPQIATGGGRREGAVRVTAAALTLARWLDGFGCPVVLLIDDAFRAPPEAAAMLAALANRSAAVPWTIVSTLRENDRKARAGTRVLTLEPMPVGDRLVLLECALGSQQAARRVFDWFGSEKLAMPGNIIEAARAIQRSQALVADGGELRVVPARLFQGAGDVLKSVAHRISMLSPSADLLALAAALWGDSAPLDGLAHALRWPRERLLDAADELVQSGIVAVDRDALRFTHDQVRAGVLDVAATAERQRICVRMAARLIEASEPSWTTTALHFRLTAGLDDANPAVWRDRFADGAAVARGRANAAVAGAFAEAAWQLRQRAGPAAGNADRLLIKEALLAAADREDTVAVHERARLLIDGAVATSAIAEAYELAIYALWTVRAAEACWSLVCEGLRRFGVHIPFRPTRLAWLCAIVRWRLHVARATIPSRADPVSEAVVRIAHAAAYPAFERNPGAAMLLALKGSTAARGRAQSSAYWKALDAFLSASLGRFADAARFGDLAIAESRTLSFGHAATLYRASFFGSVWRTPQSELRDQCLEIFNLAIAEGDLSTAAGALRNWLVIGWRTSACLRDLAHDLAEAEGVLTWLYSSKLKDFVDTLKTVLRDVMEPGAAYRPDRFARTPSQPLYTFELSTYRQDWPAGLAAAAEFRSLKKAYAIHPGGPVWCFHEALSRLKSGLKPARADLAYLNRVAALNPQDYGAKLAVIEAEQLAQARSPHALAAYARAVELALRGPRRLEAGIAAELARDCALSFRDDALAQQYELRAQTIWQEWGARAKERPQQVPEISQALNLAQAEASAAAMSSRAKSRLLADVAHELRTPMQGMQSLLELAGEKPEALDLAALRDVLTSLKTITDELTDYGAFCAGEAVLPRRPTALRDLLANEARIFDGGGRNVELAIAADVPASVALDGDRVRQVVRNLLSNAAKYGGPRIWLSADAEIRPDRSLRMTVCVEDDGPGLGDGELLLIFEPFERGTRQGDGRGMGLGLALSRRIAERLGGQLRAENRDEGGARFIFTFEAGEAAAVETQGVLGYAPCAFSILLAEDVALNRMAIADLLRRDGHRVVEASDGLEAIAALDRQAFDVAFVDLSMPRASGIDVLRAIAAMPHGPLAIVLTASSDPAQHDKARAAGARLVLQKPLSRQDLREALRPLAGSGTPAPVNTNEPSFETAMFDLAEAARDEIHAQTAGLLAALQRQEASAAQAHRLAGLAAQFDRPQLAQIADAVSLRLRADADCSAVPELGELTGRLAAFLSKSEQAE